MGIAERSSTHEQSRARYPDEEGYVERDGVRVFYEVYGEGERTILFLPTWAIVHSRVWKLQVAYFARHARVVTFDARGNGRSDRPRDPRAYDEREIVADAVAVLDAVGVERAAVVCLSNGAHRALLLADGYPDRVERIAFICPAVPLGEPLPERAVHSFDDELDTDEGWAKTNRHYWLRDWRGYVEYFFSRCFTEPHSTKQIEDCVGWALETDAETMLLESESRRLDADEMHAIFGRLACPSVVIQGDEDAITGPSRGIELAAALGAPLVLLEGAGHVPEARDPVRVNLLLRDFLCPPPPAARWVRGKSRRKRALYVSSPIGLGHARRDVAIAQELRKLHPDLEIDWLAQHPVTVVLEAEGERIHPASALLANESVHIECESAEHDLHAFQAIRRMDEILVANFMLFLDVVREENYDLWIGDEAWEVDYFLHENPELKSAAYVWLTDFVGWLPMEDGGERESFLTADYNAEMIEHIARFPRIRDRAVFVGDPEDVVSDSFGPNLPGIRDWTEQHYDFAGYVTGFEPVADREKLRAELGYGPREKVCIVTVGGSGVGGHLLHRVIDAFPRAKAHVPELRMIVVAGPRIDPASLHTHEGLEIRPYVNDLYRHLPACDLAVVQGGL
ncbi:MAG: alpha/beta fold hydrolase, partial [Actinobacteria bacterium]|nr:alpha/beta fold hydrolase [Actinomycetota bacterium]